MELTVLENYFQIPGLGKMMVDALHHSDFPVLKTLVFIGSVLYVLCNTLSDILYAMVDPRVKLR